MTIIHNGSVVIYLDNSVNSVIQRKKNMIAIVLLTIYFSTFSNGKIIQLKLPMEVSNRRSTNEESSFCAFVDIEEPIYINQIIPFLNNETNHVTVTARTSKTDKMFDKFNSDQEFVECGNINLKPSDEPQTASFEKGHKVETLFVTSRFGNAMELPPGVAFEVGKVKTRLVLQVHFQPRKTRHFEEIGVNIYYSTHETPFKAGIYTLVAGGKFTKLVWQYFSIFAF